MSKNIIVFGASGGIGSQSVIQALDLGYQVTAVVRNPQAFTIRHVNLTIRQGDVMLPHTFESAMQGQHAVISALGTGNTKPTTLYSQGIRHIIAAMQQYAVPRISAISAGGLYLNDTMGLFRRFLVGQVLQRILKEPYADLRIMETELRETDLKYTIVRPARLTDKPLTGQYRSVINGHLKSPSNIARADVAHYLIHQLENRDTYKSIIEIAY